MRLHLKIVFSVIFVLNIFNAKSQEFYESAKPFSTKSNTLNYKLTGRQYYFRESLNGTVYLNNEWLPGSVLLKNGDRFENVFLKLNTFLEDLIYFNEQTGAILILDKFIIDEFEINTGNSHPLFKKMYFSKYPKGEHYFNLIYDVK